MSSGEGPASPCVSVCALDENDLCIGCLRTGDEISRWGGMTVCEKKRVMDNVAQREGASALCINAGKQ